MNDTHEPQERIVVGLDGSEPSEQALRWAIRQAGLTGGRIEAVMAWEYPQSYGWGSVPPSDDTAALEGTAGQVLADSVVKVAGPDPEVEIAQRVEQGQAAKVLLDAADGAAILVLGSRGHGGFAGALLGSVGQHCIQHAQCPVVVIRGKSG